MKKNKRFGKNYLTHNNNSMPVKVNDFHINALENVFTLFLDIQETSKRKEKQLLLQNYPDQSTLKDILFYTYNPYYVYGVGKKTVDSLKNYGHESSFALANSYGTVYDLLESLRSKRGTDSNDIIKIESFISSIDNKFIEGFIKKMLLRDLSIGVGVETINSVFKKLIPVFSVSLCVDFNKINSLSSSTYHVQSKLDGVRIIAICSRNSPAVYTRNGNQVVGYDDILEVLKYPSLDGYVLDGEILSGNFDTTMEGLFAELKDKKAKLCVFDMLTIKEFNEKRCTRTYSDRHEKYNEVLSDIFNTSNGIVYPLDSVVKTSKELSHERLSDMNKRAMGLGYEGLILKASDSCYQFKRHESWIKYKSMHTGDYEIIGIKEGENKYTGMLGAITVDVNGVSVDVGSGFSDEQRKSFYENDDVIGMTAEIKYQEITKDGSLRFPVFLKLRNDK